MSILGVPDGVDVDRLHPSVVALFARPQWAQRTPEWYAVRRGLLTASDAAAALGVRPFAGYRGDPRADLLRRKVQNAPVRGMALAHGVKYEPEACAAAMAALGETCFDFGLVVHPEHPWLAASPDGVTATGRCVEIKCPSRRVVQPGHVPAHYLPQVQIQMYVTGCDATYFVQYKPAFLNADGKPFLDICVVQRDDAWLADALPVLRAFWQDMTAAVADAGGSGPVADDDASAGTCVIVDDLYERNVRFET